MDQELYNKAKRLVIKQQRVSAMMIKHNLNITLAETLEIIKELEFNRIISKPYRKKDSIDQPEGKGAPLFRTVESSQLYCDVRVSQQAKDDIEHFLGQFRNENMSKLISKSIMRLYNSIYIREEKPKVQPIESGMEKTSTARIEYNYDNTLDDLARILKLTRSKTLRYAIAYYMETENRKVRR